MAGQYDRRRFLARLLLLSASVDSGQGSTSLNSCACHAARVTFEESDREKQRRKHTPYVVDSGATLHCIKVVGAPFLASCRGAVGQPPQPPRRPPGDVRAESFGELPAPAAVQAW